ncbi:MAG: peptidase [Acidiferrobacteraceae bacterium]|jgi:predicted HD phosphohydrolase|nr:peptidase [Acidiferrobacteraceae bacterium]MCP4828849.1 HD domain-containing protein [Pseudomonadota bacterium]MDP6950175.1 HD domain-containing protein [Arenicellales bacterium]HJP06760.1 HD domain-containing protein [Arenicellales bacterium]|tara:strand:- start:1427 stop:2002 length:576 start_codon:yes stop_codon:yes gene_type:complete
MEVVGFKRMADGSREDYEFLGEMERKFVDGLPDRILTQLRLLSESFSGYPVSRLEHSLQSATRAHRAEETEEMVVAALVHDIGDVLAPMSHSEMAASILRPFVSEKTYWIIKYHGLFQMYYYAHHLGGDRNARARFAEHRWYNDAVRFCEEYDQNCFDPEYDSEPLEFFEPMLRRLFRHENASDDNMVSRV